MSTTITDQPDTGQSPQPPKRGHRRLIVGGAALAVVVIAVGIGAATSGQEGSTSSPAPTAVAEPYSPPPAVEDPAPTMQEQVAAWWSEAEGPFTEWQDDQSALVDTLSSTSAVIVDPTDAIALARQCQDDVAILAQLGAVPDPDIDEPWQAALADFDASYGHLAEGLVSYDTDLIVQSTQEMTDGTAHIEEATAAIG